MVQQRTLAVAASTVFSYGC